MKTFILGLALGAAVGWGLAQMRSVDSRETSAAKPAARATAPASETRVQTEVRRESFSTESMESAEPRRRSAERVASGKSLSEMSGLEQLAELMRLAKERKFQLQISLLDGRAGGPRKCSQAFREFFDLTDSEAGAIDQALARAQAAQQKIMAERAVVKTNADGALKIEVPFFVEEGGEIYDELNQTMARVLGDERKRALDGMRANELEDIYDGLGTKALSFDLSRNGQGFSWKRAANGGAGGGSTTATGGAKPETLRQVLGELYTHPKVQAWIQAQR